MVDLVVTSPPYPMISMWDDCFTRQTDVDSIEGEPEEAYQAMHCMLEDIFLQCVSVLRPGAFLCINIGDATRTLGGRFRMFDNHGRIVSRLVDNGLDQLPSIIWRKQTNAPNKFMGSGMLPCGAYVTLEHEHILIFRKRGRREFKTGNDRLNRRRSAYFWEERNVWFSDVWDVKGVRQGINGEAARERSGAYPVEIPYRLINMFSVKGDTVLDPFMGCGTTMLAAMASERNSIGFEADASFANVISDRMAEYGAKGLNALIDRRLKAHIDFINERLASGKDVRYQNDLIGCGVVTSQETDIEIRHVADVGNEEDGQRFTVAYCP